MLSPWVCLATLVVAVAAFPNDLPNTLPKPSEPLYLNEEQFEDYLDAWLAIEELKWVNASLNSHTNLRTDCVLNLNEDLGQPQPVYLQKNDYISPSGTSGQILLNTGEEVVIACTGSHRTIIHPNAISTISTGTVRCASNAQVTATWLNGVSDFKDLTCSNHASHNAEATNERCFNNNLIIRVGYIVENDFYPLYWSCFDQNTMEVLYVWYKQIPENSIHQTGVIRPNFMQGPFFPGLSTNTLYSQAVHKETIAGLVGEELADQYVTDIQFLARGHLASKTDFVFATGQRASFHYINAAPQWQPFNRGNWNSLEQDIRARIGAANYHTTVYTGTFGVTQLRNQNNILVDIYLARDENNNGLIPVPLYYYKVVYESSTRLGTAYVGINNPYYTEEEVKQLTFCTDLCRNNPAFDWLKWKPDRIDLGYSFCCTVDDFKRTVPHLPEFRVDGLLI